MKISHLFFLGLAAATAVSCSNDGIDGEPTPGGANGAKTLLSVSATVRTGQSEVRAANDFERNYNYLGEYLGKDEIGAFDVFVGSENATEGTNGVIYRNFSADAAAGSYATTTSGVNTRVYPKDNTVNAIEVLAAAKKQVNVMLNADLTTEGAALISWIRTGGNAAGLTQRWFDDKYDLNAMNLSYVTTPGTVAFPTAPQTAVSKIATHVGGKDKILMTSEDFVNTYTLAENVTAAQTVAAGANAGATANAGAASTANRFVRDIRRAAARVYVTASQDASTQPYVIKEGALTLGEVSSLQFVVGQGERRFYVGQKRVDETSGARAATYAASLNQEVRTPAYDYDAAQYDATAADSGALAHYDYATLWMDAAGGGTRTVNTAAQLSAGVKVGQRGAAFAAGDLTTAEADKLLNGTFFLPTTHKAATSAASGYKKGNTTYVLVRGKFTPATFSDMGAQLFLSEKSLTPPYYTYASAKTTVINTTQSAGDAEGTFYYTSQGKFFRTIEGAIKSFNSKNSSPSPTATTYKEDADTYVVPTGQWIKRYPAGKMLWTLWVNPSADIATQQYWSAPTVRNNIYAIHITGISGLGENWNPLVPKPFADNGSGGNLFNDYNNKFNPDPNPNVDPRVGGTVGTPNNPDDPTLPEDPNDPKDPPYNPEDPEQPNNPDTPLPNPKTNMSVEAGVLPWQVHGYSTVL